MKFVLCDILSFSMHLGGCPMHMCRTRDGDSLNLGFHVFISQFLTCSSAQRSLIFRQVCALE